jgi:hypothetical protein
MTNEQYLEVLLRSIGLADRSKAYEYGEKRHGDGKLPLGGGERWLTPAELVNQYFRDNRMEKKMTNKELKEIEE